MSTLPFADTPDCGRLAAAGPSTGNSGARGIVDRERTKKRVQLAAYTRHSAISTPFSTREKTARLTLARVLDSLVNDLKVVEARALERAHRDSLEILPGKCRRSRGRVALEQLSRRKARAQVSRALRQPLRIFMSARCILARI